MAWRIDGNRIITEEQYQEESQQKLKLFFLVMLVILCANLGAAFIPQDLISNVHNRLFTGGLLGFLFLCLFSRLARILAGLGIFLTVFGAVIYGLWSGYNWLMS